MQLKDFNDLSRPEKGKRNTVTLANGLRYAKVISRKFICPKCRTFCGELVPVLDRRVRDWMRRNRKTLTSPELQVRIYCYAGCHNHPAWGWENFNWGKVSERNRIREWPDEWSGKEIQEAERKAREADENVRKGGYR